MKIKIQISKLKPLDEYRVFDREAECIEWSKYSIKILQVKRMWVEYQIKYDEDVEYSIDTYIEGIELFNNKFQLLSIIKMEDVEL